MPTLCLNLNQSLKKELKPSNSMTRRWGDEENLREEELLLEMRPWLISISAIQLEKY